MLAHMGERDPITKIPDQPTFLDGTTLQDTGPPTAVQSLRPSGERSKTLARIDDDRDTPEVRIRQYVYFALDSDVVPAAEVTKRLGIDPDRVLVQSSKSTDPPRPARHSWQLRCDESGMCVDDQVQGVIRRLGGAVDAIAQLTADGGEMTARLQVVRHFDAPDGEEGEVDEPTSLDREYRKMEGQHQLLGWHLDRRTLEFLVRTRAELDIDEYG